MINKQRILNDFFELVQIKCSTLQEREIGDLLTKRLQELGFSVTEDQAGKKLGGNCGNLIATRQGSISSAPKLMLTAHMDCVEPCSNIRPQLKDGLITSDGTTILGADDKAGIAAIFEALHCLKEQNIPHGDLQVVFTVAEEGGVNGSKNMDHSLLKADLGYTLDTGGHPGKITCRAPGQDKIFVKIQGKSAHAGIAPENGINAISAAAHIRRAILLIFFMDFPQNRMPRGRVDEKVDEPGTRDFRFCQKIVRVLDIFENDFRNFTGRHFLGRCHCHGDIG